MRSLAALVGILVAGGAAAADPGRIALGAADPNLRAALFVRGLDVVETKPLVAASALVEARARATAMDVDAVVWLCDLGKDLRGLCLYDRRDDAIYVRHLPLSTPLSSTDAAGVALSVKVLLAPRSEVRQQADAELPALEASPQIKEARSVWTVEASGGGRFWDDGAAARVGVDGAWVPGRFGLGAGVSFGPDSTGRLETMRAPDRQSDVTLRLYGRARARLSPVWLDFDVGPSVHLVSVDRPMLGSDGRTDVSLDARIGVVLPLARFFTAARVGGYVLVQDDSFDHRANMGLDLTLSVGYGF